MAIFKNCFTPACIGINLLTAHKASPTKTTTTKKYPIVIFNV